MKNTKKIKINEIAQPMLHHKPRTRRDFLALGYLAGVGYVAAPSFLTTLWNNMAYGAPNCAAMSGTNHIAAINFDLVGGANIPSFIVAGGAGGQLDHLPMSALNTVGITTATDPRTPANIDNSMGLITYSRSTFLQGVKQNAPANVLNRVDGFSICVRTPDDIGANISATHLYAKAGAKGQLTAILGSRATASGGVSRAVNPDPSLSPVVINSLTSGQNLVKYGRLVERLGKDKAKAILNAAAQMSNSQLAQFNTLSLEEQSKVLVQCGYIKAPSAFDIDGDFLNPINDQALTAIPYFSNLAQGDTNKQSLAAMLKLLGSGMAGAATMIVPGCDYHDGTRTTANRIDNLIGQQIGATLAYFAACEKPVMISFTTDGGTACSEAGAVQGFGTVVSDDGTRSLAGAFCFFPNGKVELRKSDRRQIGHYNSGGAVALANKASNSPETAAKVFALNYLSLLGKEGTDQTRVFGKEEFSAAEIDEFCVFTKKV